MLLCHSPKEPIMSVLKIARPVGLAVLIALGVAAAGAADAHTGLQSEHGPSALQSSHGPTYPNPRR
jgi:hypothetical protein